VDVVTGARVCDMAGRPLPDLFAGAAEQDEDCPATGFWICSWNGEAQISGSSY
jgi:hypothetical protein